MLYVPLHFLVNNHRAIEKELGVERYARLLYDSGYKSARTWCAHEARIHGLTGKAVFEHYMNRISQRGWGKFEILEFSIDEGTALISLKHSAFQWDAQPDDQSGDYMFTGWFAGAMDQILDSEGKLLRTRARQVGIEGLRGLDHGLFRVSPK